MCGVKPCAECANKKSIGKMANKKSQPKKRRRKRTSTKKGVGFIKRTGKNAEVDLMKFGVAAGITGGGYLLSNIATAQINKMLTKKGTEPDKKLDANVSGLVKIILGGGIAWAGAKYAPKKSMEIAALVLGMAASGMQNIAAKQLENSESQLVAQALGLNDGSTIPVSTAGTPYNNLPAGSADGVAERGTLSKKYNY